MNAPAPLVCPLCRSTHFTREVIRVLSRWGFTRTNLVMMTCQGCQHVLLFRGDSRIYTVR